MNCKQHHPWTKLGSPCPFPSVITVTLSVPLWNVCICKNYFYSHFLGGRNFKISNVFGFIWWGGGYIYSRESACVSMKFSEMFQRGQRISKCLSFQSYFAEMFLTVCYISAIEVKEARFFFLARYALKLTKIAVGSP